MQTGILSESIINNHYEMYLLYNLLIILFVTKTSPFWLYKVVTKEKHRKGFWEKLGVSEVSPSPSGRGEGVRVGFEDAIRIHIHAVSVGEVIAAAPFIKELRQRHPEIRLTLSP